MCAQIAEEGREAEILKTAMAFTIRPYLSVFFPECCPLQSFHFSYNTQKLFQSNINVKAVIS